MAAVARRDAAFAVDAPALYDAMFSRSTRLRFGEESLAAPSSAFFEIRESIASQSGVDDPELLTEALWAALHGLIVLDRDARLRPRFHDDRIDLVVKMFVPRTADKPE